MTSADSRTRTPPGARPDNSRSVPDLPESGARSRSPASREPSHDGRDPSTTPSRDAATTRTVARERSSTFIASPLYDILFFIAAPALALLLVEPLGRWP